MCSCQVCQALAGVEVVDILAAVQVAAQLPSDVLRVLEAQSRVVEGNPTPRDLEVVRQAAQRCTAGRFQAPGVVQ